MTNSSCAAPIAPPTAGVAARSGAALQKRFSLSGASGSSSVNLNQQQRHSWIAGATGSAQIPRFYYPHGRPYSAVEIDAQMRRILAAFSQYPGRCVTRKEFVTIVKAAELPLYWKEPLFLAVATLQPNSGPNNNKKTTIVTADAFVEYWKR